MALPIYQAFLLSLSLTLSLTLSFSLCYHGTGYVHKKGQKVKNWKKRFMVLQGADLKYFEKDEGWQYSMPKGIVSLHTANLKMVNDGEDKGCLEIITKDRKFVFTPVEDNSRDKWVAAIDTNIALAAYFHRCALSKVKEDVRVLELGTAQTLSLSFHFFYSLSLSHFLSLSLE